MHMTRIKLLLSATVLLAVTLVSAVYAATALASGPTVLCELNLAQCPDGYKYTGHIDLLAIRATEISGKFFGITGTIACKNSNILGNALGLANPVLIHVEVAELSGNCHLLAPFINEPCTAVESKALGLFDLLRTAPNFGEATSLGNTFYLHCGNLINCTLGGEPKFQVSGSEGSLGSWTTPSGGATLSNISGSNCPEGGSSHLSATYSIQLPDIVYLSS
jgi:hypothetical protein